MPQTTPNPLFAEVHADILRGLRFVIPPAARVLCIGRDDRGYQLAVQAAASALVVVGGPPAASATPTVAELTAAGEVFDYVILADVLGEVADIQDFLSSLRPLLHAGSRLVSLTPSRAWQPAFRLATRLGLRSNGHEPNWISLDDLHNLLYLSDYDVVSVLPRCPFPLPIPGLAALGNRLLVHLPVCRWFSTYNIVIARPLGLPVLANPSLSVIIPVRNEAGNLEAAIQRTPELGAFTELIFVEGGSADNSWEVLQQLQQQYAQRRRIKILRQPGKGKNDAVMAGFAVAEGDLLTILDGDLTMPPEELPKFYGAVASGRCEFANGSRLVYPMENEAMRFLNILANHFFALAFSWLLGQRLKDTLCGTKMLSRAHYRALDANRGYFGDFDPFGDFDLIFGAAKLRLKIRDIPIHYKARSYGTTNISRWSHGLLLLRMVLFAFRKLKLV